MDTLETRTQIMKRIEGLLMIIWDLNETICAAQMAEEGQASLITLEIIGTFLSVQFCGTILWELDDVFEDLESIENCIREKLNKFVASISAIHPLQKAIRLSCKEGVAQ